MKFLSSLAGYSRKFGFSFLLKKCPRLLLVPNFATSFYHGLLLVKSTYCYTFLFFCLKHIFLIKFFCFLFKNYCYNISIYCYTYWLSHFLSPSSLKTSSFSTSGWSPMPDVFWIRWSLDILLLLGECLCLKLVT